MKVSEKLQELGIDPGLADFSDILLALGKQESLESIKDQVGDDLVALLSFVGLSRTELASRLRIEKSRITRILSGKENLTLKTINDVSKAAGFDFDVIFRNKKSPKNLQPWQMTFIEKPTYGQLFTVRQKVSPTVLPINLDYIVANEDNMLLQA